MSAFFAFIESILLNLQQINCNGKQRFGTVSHRQCA